MSGYDKYNPKQRSLEVKRNTLELYPELPKDKCFSIIYLDPAWHYGNKLMYDRSASSKHNPGFIKDIFLSAANFKYPTLKLSELKQLDIPSIAAQDCLMFMWVTNPHLAQGIELAKHWNFEYRTVGFVWNKMQHNPGQYTLSYCELCLIFKKGKIPQPRGARNIKQYLAVPRTVHSEKPKEVIAAIDEMFPTQQKIEMFSRGYPYNETWQCWGNDVKEEFV
jgi:N6-adenosine-specific RNA methylase IME4